MSDLLIEPGSTKHGPRIGVTYMPKYYDFVDRRNKTPPWFTEGYSAGVFLAKPGCFAKSMRFWKIIFSRQRRFFIHAKFDGFKKNEHEEK